MIYTCTNCSLQITIDLLVAKGSLVEIESDVTHCPQCGVSIDEERVQRMAEEEIEMRKIRMYECKES